MGRVTDLQERYGSPRRTTRVIALVVIVALVASGVGFLGWAVFSESTPSVTSQLSAWHVESDHLVVANLTVGRESEFTKASCVLQALAEDHSVVGQVTVPVTDGPTTQSLRVEIRTERRATSVEPIGCTAPDQPRPR